MNESTRIALMAGTRRTASVQRNCVTSTRIPDAVKDRIDRIAATEDTSTSNVVYFALLRGLELLEA